MDNTLKTGLEQATRDIIIELLNETYPRTTRAQPVTAPLPTTVRAKIHNPNDWVWGAENHDSNDWSWSGIGGRRRLPELKQAAAHADAAALGIDMETYTATIHKELTEMYNMTRRSRHLQVHDKMYTNYIRGSRRLVYYTDENPVEITMIIDNPNCPANNENGQNTIRCAIVSSRLCVVLEEGDNPIMIRNTLVNGLSDAIQKWRIPGQDSSRALRKSNPLKSGLMAHGEKCFA